MGRGLKSRAAPAPARICSTSRPHLLWPCWGQGDGGSLGIPFGSQGGGSVSLDPAGDGE